MSEALPPHSNETSNQLSALAESSSCLTLSFLPDAGCWWALVPVRHCFPVYSIIRAALIFNMSAYVQLTAQGFLKLLELFCVLSCQVLCSRYSCLQRCMQLRLILGCYIAALKILCLKKFLVPWKSLKHGSTTPATHCCLFPDLLERNS